MKKLLFSFSVFFIFVLVGCSEKPKPETTFQQYMDAWNEQAYDKMYSALSAESKKSISEEAFINRYETIYDGIEASNIQVEYKLPEEENTYKEEDMPSFDYQLSMETLGGTITSTHKATFVYEEGEEESRWGMKWSPSMIFPEMEAGDQVRAKAVQPARGEIFDVNGEPLAVNGTMIQIGLVPEWMQGDEEAVKKKVASLLDMKVSEINDKLNQEWVTDGSFVPLKSVSKDNTSLIEELRPLNGTKFEEMNARVYPQGEATAHLIGYVGSITEEQLKDWEDKGYTKHSVVGRTGLENVLELSLSGTPGGEVSIIDEQGEKKTALTSTDAKNGEDIHLTVDATLQQDIYQQMDGQMGSAAAIHPQTGEVKALVSSPAYDPNQFILGMSGAEYNKLVEHSTNPLMNRFSSTYSPGSTFKAITAAVGLETNVIDPNKEMKIEGKSYSQDGWGNYSVNRVSGAATDNAVTLEEALYRSDNIYFARSMLDIGGERFLQESKQFGFGEKIPFLYPINSSQIITEGPFESDVLLADTGYGQGQVQMSTLHAALSYTPFVTGGTLLQPVMEKGKEKKKAWHEDVISSATIEEVTTGLKKVVSHPQGTAYKPVVDNIAIAGKTGTAEIKEQQGEKGKELGWFVAWNTDKKDLMVSMMIEDTKDGSQSVEEYVKQIFQQHAE
ncbi:penicillin-binding transpeptidase domain-containing protein [Pontibacillus litoralis]|uniref:serine-type D-Ala-D-Ala carboxypeptidase n=1 Tax=Pontibacillus litoralis JSM 072002 TaxID=1385512 RepID=A0A0A5G172_9BACI|nr:penicillin-binding transpeptidase domain-containing protein [Pontibacillus litoralis]KGX86851.1 MecA protein [Pontibacillus litoralis JSM 072002]